MRTRSDIGYIQAETNNLDTALNNIGQYYDKNDVGYGYVNEIRMALYALQNDLVAEASKFDHPYPNTIR